MAATSKSLISPELRLKVSPSLLMLADEAGAFKILGIVLAVLGLYGPVTVHPDHNGFLYLLGPWVCPSVVALIWSSVPKKPYRGVFYNQTMHDVDSNDPAVMHLVELYKSEEVRRHLWFESLKLSGILFAILGSAAFLLRDSLNWTLPSLQNQFLWSQKQGPGHWFWVGLILACIGCFLALGSASTGWCLRTWAAGEARR